MDCLPDLFPRARQTGSRRGAVSGPCSMLLAGLVWVVLAGMPAAAQPTKIIAFGDSITRGFGDGSATCSSTSFGYPPRVRAWLADQGFDVVIVNEGACGELTFEGLSRIEQVLDRHPDASIVLLMEGTNDLSTFASLESIRTNVREMGRKVEERGMVPVILSVIPRGPGSGRDSDNRRTNSFAGWLAYEASVDGRIFGDPFQALIGVANLFDRFYSDPWHPNRSGYGLLTTTIGRAALEAIPPPEPPFGLTCTDELGRLAVPPGPCEHDEEGSVLCLRDDRFRLEVVWETFDGDRGVGRRRPLTRDTGSFYFFNPANTELIVKILDASSTNGFFWVFYGALSNVRYSMRVVDTVSGACRVYENPLGTFASVGDTQALPGDEPDPPPLSVRQPATDTVTGTATATEADDGPESTCIADDVTLCLQQGRFSVRATWEDFNGRTGVAQTVPLSADTGAFYFFKPTNIELVVKVLDGREFNDRFWVFYGALSNVRYVMTVTDTVTGETRTYENPLNAFASVGDTDAFPLPAPEPASSVP